MFESELTSTFRTLFLESGYRGTTLRRLAKAAGIGEREFYERVGSKCAVAIDALEWEVLRWEQIVSHASSCELDPVVEAFRSIRREQGIVPIGLLAVELVSLTAEEPELREPVAAAHRRMAQSLEALLVATGRHNGRGREVSIFALGAILGLTAIAKADRDSWELESGLETLSSMLGR